MCFTAISNWFKKPPAGDPTPLPVPVPIPPIPPVPPAPPLALTHPEEPANPEATVDNVDVSATFMKWLRDWMVPQEQRVLWSKVIIELNPNNPYGAACSYYWEIPPRVVFKPAYLNPGAMAHEFAHYEYFERLTLDQQETFSATYQQLMLTDPLLQLMRDQKPYVQMNFSKNFDVEGHAEVYRYLGDKMPAELRIFYPDLL